MPNEAFDMGPIPVVVLNWNGLADTIECVDALLEQSYAKTEIYLVDNGSDGDDYEQLAQRYQANGRITLSRNSQNLGFTGGVNRALEGILARQPDAQAIALLNNDTLPDPRWLQSLVDSCAQQNADLVGSRMVNYFKAEQLDNAGHIWLDSGEILPRGTGENPAAYAEPAWLIGVCAGAMLLRTRLLRQIGLLDPFFGTGYEDAEFGLRAFLAGSPSYYEPAAVVRHKISQSIDKVRSPEYARQIQVNINYTYGKLAPAGTALLNAIPIALKTLGVLTIALLTARWRLLRAHLNAIGSTLQAWPAMWRARRQAAKLRTLSALQAWRSQQFFLPVHFGYFRRYILTGEKTVFEK